jgi:Na+-translocating ferredoxin:NAD+ oxidoreductase subunit G
LINSKRSPSSREPLPEDYERYLKAMGKDNGGLSPDEVAEIQKHYLDKDIYALTGATISSAAVTNGVKAMARKFAYRIQILDQAVDAGNVPVLF